MDMDADNEKDVLCEKIINDIHAVIQNDPDLSSFEIVPTVHQCNKSPVKHVEHHLGLDAWCTKHVYDHAHRMLLTQRRQHPHSYLQRSDNLVKYLNVVLLINPDVTSFWHIRRQLVQKTRLHINQEFKFAALTLSKKPKSNESFAYRRWLFSFQSAESIDWPNEVGICDRCADRSSNNYHAWSHRQWVLQNAPFLIKSELLLTEKFMQKHLSDYSCCCYRQHLLRHAYDMCYFDPEELPHLLSLKELLNRHLIAPVQSSEDLLQVILPEVDVSLLAVERVKAFLYCCNLAAHDMLLMEAQMNKFGQRESFELHRRSMLKFIVDQCVRLLSGEKLGRYLAPRTYLQAQEFDKTLRSFDYTSNAFLAALQKAESMHGPRNRQWSAIFLGFNQPSS